MGPEEQPTILEQALLLVAVCVCVYGATVILLSLEHKNAPRAPVSSAAGSDSPPSGQPAALSFPLNYSAVVCQSGDGMPERKCRYYIKESL